MPRPTAQHETRQRKRAAIRHSRINPIALYMVSLACTVLAYCLYAKYAVPIIEGPPNIVKRPIANLAELTRPINDHSNLDHLFPANAWELGACKTLETSSGTLLFQDFQPLDDGYVEVFPFTMVMKRDESKSDITNPIESVQPKSPMVLRCANKARLKFDKPVSLGGLGQKQQGGAQKLIGARLVGTVTINRQPMAADKSDGFSLLTSNVQITTDQIFTLEMVDFRFGNNYGRGRNLTVDLSHADHVNDVTRDFSNVEGIRRIELAFLNELRIEPPAKKKKLDATMDSERKLMSANKVPLKVSCEGPFIFDFEKKLATFRKNVNIQQLDRFGDSIQCQLITLVFYEDVEDQEAIELSPDGEEKKMAPDLKIKRMVAEGKPATLISNSRKARVTGEFLAYNLLNETLVARSETSVTILNEEMQLDARRLNYVPNKDGSLGNLSADGPGRMVRKGKEPKDDFSASWEGRLTVQKDPNAPGRKILEFDNKASISMARKSNIDADKMKFWFWEVEQPKKADDLSVNAAALAKTEKKPAPKMIPARLFAQGNVKIKSPTLSGRTQELTAEWPEGRPANAKLGFSNSRTYQPVVQIGRSNIYETAARVQRRGRRSLQDERKYYPNQAQPSFEPNDLPVRGNREVGVRGTFTGTVSGTGDTGNEHGTLIAPVRLQSRVVPATFNQVPAKEKRHMDFVGDRVLLKFDSFDPEAKPTHVDIVGKVEINESDAGKPGKKPLKIVGERLLITPLGNDLNEMAVTGSPSKQALIVAEGLQLAGQDIFLNQQENKMWVEGAGRMQIRHHQKPAAVGSAPLDSAARNKPTAASAQNIDVSWGRGMIFEGKKIYFEQDVIMNSDRAGSVSLGASINGSAQNSDATKPKSGSTQTKTLSQGLSVHLTRPVDFSKLSGGQKVGNIEVSRISLVESLSAQSSVFRNAAFSANAQQTATPIIIENRSLDSSGKTTEIQRMMVAKADVNAQTGEIFASGPGKIVTHRFGKSSIGFETPGIGPARQQQKKPRISALQVNFDGTLSGNSSENNLIVEGNVRLLNSPVKSWDIVYDPDTTTRIPVGAVKMVCDKIMVEQWKPRAAAKATTEMIATGNAHIWGDLFEAVAQRVSYDEANDMLTISGTSRSDAKLWYQTAPNAERSPLVAGKLLYRPSTQSFQILQVKSATLNQSGNLFGGNK